MRWTKLKRRGHPARDLEDVRDVVSAGHELTIDGMASFWATSTAEAQERLEGLTRLDYLVKVAEPVNAPGTFGMVVMKWYLTKHSA